MMKKIVIIILLILPFLVGCKKVIGPTTVSVVDSVRHYYPIIQGEKIKMIFEIKNTGNQPLVINDIQPSSLSLTNTTDNDVIIMPGMAKPVEFVYDSSMNLGYVHEVIRIFGNLATKGVLELSFDTNVVSPTQDPVDYEIFYTGELKEDERHGLKKAVDGNSETKSYYVDNHDRNMRKINSTDIR